MNFSADSYNFLSEMFAAAIASNESFRRSVADFIDALNEFAKCIDSAEATRMLGILRKPFYFDDDRLPPI